MTSGPRIIPARTLPIPDTVSPQLRPVIAQAPDPAFVLVPETVAAWKARVADHAAKIEATLPALQRALNVTVTPDRIAGVHVFRVMPGRPAPHHAGQALVHLHGGARVLMPGLAGTREAILMAGLVGISVISVDYRMPPDHPYPAALDDALAVCGAVVAACPPATGLLGFSAGGGLVYATLLAMRAQGLPMPGAVVTGSPNVDLGRSGDTLQTNAGIDNVLQSQDGFIRATIDLYAAGRDVADPLLSPINGDLTGFPPAMLISGTRDLYLSNTVRMHRKLRAAGVTADLHVWEAQSHGQYMTVPDAPETRAYHAEVGVFLDRHLGQGTT